MSIQKITPFTRKDLFGGRGTVNIWNLMGKKNASPFSAVLWCELAPKGIVGLHRQQDDPEIVICIEGQGKAKVSGTEHDLEAGSMVHLPHGSSLAIKNLADSPLRYLIIKAKAQP